MAWDELSQAISSINDIDGSAAGGLAGVDITILQMIENTDEKGNVLK